MREYCATVVFFGYDDGAPIERRLSVYYKADDLCDAARGAMRFGLGRVAAMPGYFREVTCIKVYRFSTHPISDDGQLMPNTGFHAFEWKWDWGTSFEQALSAIKEDENA